MAFRIGVSQAAKATADIPNPIIFKKSLREWPGSCSTPRSTNSLSACFTNPGSFFSSSMPFQYVFLLLIEPLSVIRFPQFDTSPSFTINSDISRIPARRYPLLSLAFYYCEVPATYHNKRCPSYSHLFFCGNQCTTPSSAGSIVSPHPFP